MFIATELIDGESLDRWQVGKTAAELIAAYAPSARGLAAAHALDTLGGVVPHAQILR